MKLPLEGYVQNLIAGGERWPYSVERSRNGLKGNEKHYRNNEL